MGLGQIRVNAKLVVKHENPGAFPPHTKRFWRERGPEETAQTIEALGSCVGFVLGASQFALDEGVDVAVHDALDIAGLHAGAEVFDHLIGLEDVGTDLVAPSDVSLFAVLAFSLGTFSVCLELIELGF